MVDILLQIGVTKLVASAVLAGLAWAVQRRGGHPAVVYPLWLTVLVVLLLPAVVAVPVLPGGSAASAITSEDATLAAQTADAVQTGLAGIDDAVPGSLLPTPVTDDGKAGLAVVWLVVSATLLVWTLVRALRFRRWINRSAQPAPGELRREVAEIGRRLGLARLPAVHTTGARVSPMVCWMGGSVSLMVPSVLLDGLERQELRAVLAHELAHVHRRDHLVRWIEWLACSVFWWNPIAWWARRELRAAEEASCDALGATAIRSTPRAYAGSLLRVVELLSRPPTPPTPAFVSGIMRGRSHKALERRFTVLVSGISTVQAPRWTRATGAAAAVCLLPLGLIYCGFADQAAPTALEEAMELGLERDDKSHDEGETLFGAADWSLTFAIVRGQPIANYWIIDSVRSRGPYPLVASGLPACQPEGEQLHVEAQESIPPACVSALMAHVRSRAEPGARGVCVGLGRAGGSWSGQCSIWRLPIGDSGERSPMLDAQLIVDETGSPRVRFARPPEVPKSSIDSPELTAGDVARFTRMVLGQGAVPHP